MKRLILLKTFICIMFALLLTAGCSSQAKEDDHIAIESLYFVSATGDIYNTYSFFITEDEGRGIDFSDWDEDNLESEEATKLIEEIKNIPDNESNTGDLAYHIILVYSDGDSKQEIEKTGYNEFPENWEKIVSLINDLLDGKGEISDSRDIVTIDAEFLKTNCFYDGSNLPLSMSVEDLIDEMPITYEKLFDPQHYCYLPNEVNNFLYDYCDIGSREIKELDPIPSSSKELRSFALKKLDDLDQITDIMAVGKYRGTSFIIFRYDEFESWMNETDERDFQVMSNGSLSYIYQSTEGLEEGMSKSDTRFIYSDPSQKFLILTGSEDYGIISEVIN